MKLKQSRQYLAVALAAALVFCQVPAVTAAAVPFIEGENRGRSGIPAGTPSQADKAEDLTAATPGDAALLAQSGVSGSWTDSDGVEFIYSTSTGVLTIEQIRLPKEGTGPLMVDIPYMISSESATFHKVSQIGDYVLNAEADEENGKDGWDRVESIAIPSSVTSIGAGNFVGLSGVKELTIPDSVKSIGRLCFFGIENLEQVKLPVNMTILSDTNFCNLPALHTVTLPENLRTIEGECFINLPELASIQFPDTIRTIRSSFYHVGITEVILPGNMEFLYAGNFVDCDSLEKATILGKDMQLEIMEGDPHSFSGAEDGFTIYGYPDSRAEEFAKLVGYPFEPLKEPPLLWKYYSFANSYNDFFKGEERRVYYLTDQDWEIMENNLKALIPNGYSNVLALLKDAAQEEWGGSCYGIAVSEGLYNSGLLKLKGNSSLTPPEAKAPRSDAEIRGMVNYYFLLQYLSCFSEEMNWGCESDSQYLYLDKRLDWTNELTELVEAVEEKPLLFGYQMVVNGGLAGHAIILESVAETEEGQYQILARDNRYPGNGGTGETMITADLNARGGKGSLVLTKPSPYSGKEDILGFMDTSDFRQFDNLMPHVTKESPPVSDDDEWNWDEDILEVNTDGSWEMEIGGERLEANAAALPNSGQLKLTGSIMAASLDDAGVASPLLYTVSGASDVKFTPEDEKSPFGLSFCTDSGYSAIRAGGGASAVLAQNGAVSAQDLSGDITLSVAAGDGTLVRLDGTAKGTMEDDYCLEPSGDGAALTAPAGDYQVTLIGEGGQKKSLSITNQTDGGTVAIATSKQGAANHSSGSHSGGSAAVKHTYPSLTGTVPSSEGLGVWETRPGGQRRFQKDTGGYAGKEWLRIGGLWYLFDETEIMLTGWVIVNGTWYYLRADGVMAAGWVTVDGIWYYLKSDGAMATGWEQINGKWYYLQDNGSCLLDGITPDGYRVDESGAWIQ